MIIFRQADEMTTNVRLTVSEQEALRKKAVLINQRLVKNGKQPLRDSTIVHFILEEALQRLEVGSSGSMIIV